MFRLGLDIFTILFFLQRIVKPRKKTIRRSPQLRKVQTVPKRTGDKEELVLLPWWEEVIVVLQRS